VVRSIFEINISNVSCKYVKYSAAAPSAPTRPLGSSASTSSSPLRSWVRFPVRPFPHAVSSYIVHCITNCPILSIELIKFSLSSQLNIKKTCSKSVASRSAHVTGQLMIGEARHPKARYIVIADEPMGSGRVFMT
jgi:hypothetical protein